MLLLSLFILMLIADIGLSEQTSFTLGDTNSNDPSLKTVVIKGIAKYKPGGSAMILSLLIQGEPGIMPAGNIQTQPGISTTASPSTRPSSPPKNTASSSGSSSSGATGVKPTKGPSTSAPSSSSASSGPTRSPSAGSSTSVPAPSISTPPGSTPSSSTPSSSTPSTPPGSSTSVPSTSPSPSTGSAGFKDYEQEGLDLHNKFREMHGSQTMKLNKKMCEEAQAYAEKIAASSNMKHSNKDERSGEGENLSMGCTSTGAQTVKEAVTNWYNEVCHPGYNFDQGRGQDGTGHFTQVVWNDSVELGIGRAESSSLKCAYIVGRYKPLGNFNSGNNDYKKNVKQGSFDRNSYCATVNNNSPSRDQMNNQHQSNKPSISQILKRHVHSKRHH